jgi:hypothetical protein
MEIQSKKLNRQDAKFAKRTLRREGEEENPWRSPVGKRVWLTCKFLDVLFSLAQPFTAGMKGRITIRHLEKPPSNQTQA